MRKLLLLTALAALGACADPAARIAAPDAAPSLECNRQNGSGSLTDCECRQNGSGNLECPP